MRDYTGICCLLHSQPLCAVSKHCVTLVFTLHGPRLKNNTITTPIALYSIMTFQEPFRLRCIAGTISHGRLRPVNIYINKCVSSLFFSWLITPRPLALNPDTPMYHNGPVLCLGINTPPALYPFGMDWCGQEARGCQRKYAALPALWGGRRCENAPPHVHALLDVK
ncbi:unnamed protein product [Trypanosoma congolense IL3000]|uniref:WGS project CAEQ00000000 data, annotated contig 104 n=1 Tax=Trypanosoma congolense (strain IL3000) TaxID=1068625 RepID=F9W3F5_TRYCI|nr:unnamed protein product [Trypanosoma congolense IL3000]